MDKRCGTCRFYRPFDVPDSTFGECQWLVHQTIQLPQCFDYCQIMDKNSGMVCPCHEPKESGE